MGNLITIIWEFLNIVAVFYIVADVVFKELALPLVPFAVGWTLGAIITSSNIIEEIRA